jgi:hypothetical protein
MLRAAQAPPAPLARSPRSEGWPTGLRIAWKQPMPKCRAPWVIESRVRSSSISGNRKRGRPGVASFAENASCTRLTSDTSRRPSFACSIELTAFAAAKTASCRCPVLHCAEAAVHTFREGSQPKAVARRHGLQASPRSRRATRSERGAACRLAAAPRMARACCWGTPRSSPDRVGRGSAALAL